MPGKLLEEYQEGKSPSGDISSEFPTTALSVSGFMGFFSVTPEVFL
jgi:hypothetical protein